jgi:hypothetical protein
MGRDLAAELLEVLERWQNQPVAVRVVAGTDDVVAVFSGSLGSVRPEGAVPRLAG